MRLFTVLFCCIFVFHSPFIFAGNKLLHYEPDVVEVSGIVDIFTFPGPPGYEDTRMGDMPESCPYLKLDYPIDIDLSPNTNTLTNDEPKKNIRVLELVLHYDGRWPEMIHGSHVWVKGTLFAALTGHHHTRVLMDVHEIKAYSKKKYVHIMNDRNLRDDFNEFR